MLPLPSNNTDETITKQRSSCQDDKIANYTKRPTQQQIRNITEAAQRKQDNGIIHTGILLVSKARLKQAL